MTEGEETAAASSGADAAAASSAAEASSAAGADASSAKEAAAASSAAEEDSQTCLPGIWKLSEMKQGDEVYGEDEIAYLDQMKMVFYLDVHEDGTISAFMGDESTGTWDESSITINDTPVPYTLEGSTLSLANEEVSMTFERSSQETINEIMGYQDGVLDETVVYEQEEKTILDTDSAAVTVTGYKAGPSGFKVMMRCENKTESNIVISTATCVINKYQLQPSWAVQIKPGETEESELICSTPDLGKCGISAADELILTLQVADSDNWSMLTDGETVTLYPTGKTAEEITVPDRTPEENEKVLVDNEYCTFSILSAGDDPLLGYGVNCYFENKTDHTLTFMWESSSMNGQDMVSYFAEEAMPGVRGYAYALYLDSGMEEAGIEEVTEVGFTLKVIDADADVPAALVDEAFTYQP